MKHDIVAAEILLDQSTHSQDNELYAVTSVTSIGTQLFTTVQATCFLEHLEHQNYNEYAKHGLPTDETAAKKETNRSAQS